MAVIGKIRDKGKYLLVIFVGLALFTFILSAALDTKGGAVEQGNLGTIDGEAVDPAIYQKYVTQFVANAEQQAQQAQRPFGDRERQQSEDQAWAATVDELLLEKEYEALGINVSKAEFDSYLYGENGFSLLPEIAQGFKDPATGAFNAGQLTKFIEEREKTKDPQIAQQWKETKEALMNQRKQEKYFQVMAQGVYVTKLEAKEEYRAQKEMKSISYVLRNFRDIDDRDVKISEAEIKAFYEANKDKKKYEVLAGRDVKYFDITIEPSKSDSAEFNAEMDKIKNGWTPAVKDSLYVLSNSELRFFVSDHRATFRPAGDQKAQQGQTYPAFMDTVFKTAQVGQIVGPYNDNGSTRLAKILDFNTAVCKVRHILISAPKGDEAKIAKSKKLADSLVKLVNKDNFTEFVTKYSEDPGSKDKGGVYEDFMDYEMVAPFADFSTDKPIGTIGVVQTDFGFHIMEVLDRKEVRYPVLALIQKTLVPSETTEANLRTKATNLLYKIDRKLSAKTDILAKLNLFDTIAKQEGFFARPVRMMDEAPRVTGFNTPLAEQKILELAFNEDAQVGDLCSSPITDKGRYVIAIVSSIREKGAPSYEDAYLQMKTEAIKEKKAEKFKKQIGKNKNLDVLARQGKTIVNTAELTFGNPSIQGAGFEPEVVGAVFGALKDGRTTLPLVGNSGVYVIRLNKTTKAPAAKNYDAERNTLLSQKRGSLANEARGALQKKYMVYDNRKLNEIGIVR